MVCTRVDRTNIVCLLFDLYSNLRGSPDRSHLRQTFLMSMVRLGKRLHICKAQRAKSQKGDCEAIPPYKAPPLLLQHVSRESAQPMPHCSLLVLLLCSDGCVREPQLWETRRLVLAMDDSKLTSTCCSRGVYHQCKSVKSNRLNLALILAQGLCT